MAKRRRRITRKELKKDRFLETTTKSFTFARKHSTLILIAVIVLIAGVSGTLYYRNSQTEKLDTAKRLLSSAISWYAQNDFERARSVLENITMQYGSTESAEKALYYLGNVHYMSGEYDKAEEAFKDFLKRSNDKILAPGALLGIGDVYSQKQEYFQAAQKYLEVEKEFSQSYLVPKALLQAAHCYEAIGNVAQAESLYTKIINEYPETPFAKDATEDLALIKPNISVQIK
jgi:TolA-binding protein